MWSSLLEFPFCSWIFWLSNTDCFLQISFFQFYTALIFASNILVSARKINLWIYPLWNSTNELKRLKGQKSVTANKMKWLRPVALMKTGERHSFIWLIEMMILKCLFLILNTPLTRQTYFHLSPVFYFNQRKLDFLLPVYNVYGLTLLRLRLCCIFWPFGMINHSVIIRSIRV